MAIFTSSTFLGAKGRYKVTDGTWATARAQASSEQDFANFEAQSTTGFNIQRDFFPIDTSSIPATATIITVTFNFDGKYEAGHTGTEVHLVQTTQSNTGTRTAIDYSSVIFTSGGSVTIPDAGATARTITGNGTSLGWIVKEGITKLAIITTADQTNTQPGTQHWATITNPELVVEYTLPSTGNAVFMGTNF